MGRGQVKRGRHWVEASARVWTRDARLLGRWALAEGISLALRLRPLVLALMGGA